VGGPNQVVSASASSRWVPSPTQATSPSDRLRRSARSSTNAVHLQVDQTSVFARRMGPAVRKRPRATVQSTHGMSEHSVSRGQTYTRFTWLGSVHRAPTRPGGPPGRRL